MRSLFAVFLVVLFCSPAPSAGQQSGPMKSPPVADASASAPQPQIRPLGPQEEKDPVAQEMEKRRKKALNKERFNDLKRDTDKLLELATELKTHVDKADENMLSLDVLKKTEQIEKLAKSVRDKMKGY